MLLIFAILFLGAAAFALTEAATYPARLKARSVRLAADYGRVRVPTRTDENLRFRERVLAPASIRLASIPLKLNPRTNVEAIGAKLLAAGLSQRITPSTFLAIKGGTMVGCALLGVVFAAAASFVSAVLLLPVHGASGFSGPDFILSSRVRRRRESVRSALPDALDLLAVSVEAGLGFDGAVTKLTEHMSGPLVDEFGLLLSEMRMGESRQTALKNLAARTGAQELKSFVRAVVQADQLGISLGRILRVQAADTRLRRQAAAEEKAMKAPIKMLFPTVLFIFPSMFVVLLGPALMSVMKVLGG
ncbi:MAG: type II secretion system F family protein [Thermoleophilia bacterium]|nr:type II secretion system F family protein [Thermoleophilia bacterium]